LSDFDFVSSSKMREPSTLNTQPRRAKNENTWPGFCGSVQELDGVR
jgi:hypothetical protein